MAKAEWGVKRVCHGCTAHYYDLKKDPIICPKCGEKHDPELHTRTRRKTTVKETAAEIPTISLVELDTALVEEEFIDPDLLEGSPSEEADDSILEDASDLGGEEEELSEVIENVDHEPNER